MGIVTHKDLDIWKKGISNIAEGAARSLGSLSELETQLIISNKLKYIVEIESVLEKIEILRRKLLNFIKYLRDKHNAK